MAVLPEKVHDSALIIRRQTPEMGPQDVFAQLIGRFGKPAIDGWVRWLFKEQKIKELIDPDSE